MSEWRAARSSPNNVSTTAVDSLGDQTHQSNTASSIHQIDVSCDLQDQLAQLPLAFQQLELSKPGNIPGIPLKKLGHSNLQLSSTEGRQDTSTSIMQTWQIAGRAAH